MNHPRATPSTGTTGLADAAALLVTAATVATVLAGVGSVARVALVLVFVTFVPGWAAVGRVGTLDGPGKLALALGVSLSVCMLGAVTMVWLDRWHPQALLLILAGASALLIVGGRAVRHVWVKRPDG